MLRDTTLQGFVRALADRTPTPGGGAAAAHVAAVGAAAGAMAARFTQGRKGFAEHEAALAEEIEGLDRLAEEAGRWAEADVAAFASLRDAYALPRSSAEQKVQRRQAIQAALTEAMQPPLEICRVALETLRVLQSLSGHMNPNLASDVSVGAHCAGAAYRAGWVNVLVNLAGLADEERGAAVRAEGERMGAQVQRLEAEVTTGLATAWAR